MSNRSNQLLLKDIIHAIDKIQLYTEGMNFELFEADEKTQDAVIRNFEIIGEAANRLTEEFKLKNSNYPWQKLRGFRNRIVHDYMGIDYEIVWYLIVNELNDLKTLSQLAL